MKSSEINAADELMLDEHYRRRYSSVMREGEDWRLALDPEYWRNVADKLREGDRIEVMSFDRQIVFELIVLSVNPRISPLHLNLGARAIWPPDLDLPAPPKMPVPPYRVRQAIGGLFEIVDERGDVRRTGLYRHSALDLCEEMLEVERATRAKAPPRDFGVQRSAGPAPQVGDVDQQTRHSTPQRARREGVVAPR